MNYDARERKYKKERFVNGSKNVETHSANLKIRCGMRAKTRLNSLQFARTCTRLNSLEIARALATSKPLQFALWKWHRFISIPFEFPLQPCNHESRAHVFQAGHKHRILLVARDTSVPSTLMSIKNVPSRILINAP